MPLPILPLSPAAKNAAAFDALDFDRPTETEPLAVPVAELPCPDERQIRTQLDRILGSGAFDASPRNRAFLRYVVDQTLAGHADYIKGYSVAQEVFQRDVNFDPQLDPVVRIEARRLRRSLELYYLTAGRRDFVRIELPKGGYVPTFAFNRRDARQPPAEEPCRSGVPMVIVGRFETLGDRRHDFWARGLTDELVGRLMSYEGITVASEAACIPLAPANGTQGGDSCGSPAFLLTGSLRPSAGRLRTWVQLLDAGSGCYLWVKAYDLAFGTRDIWALQEEVAALIAQTIAGPGGALVKFLPQS